MYNIFIKSLYLCAKNRFLKGRGKAAEKAKKIFPRAALYLPDGFARLCGYISIIKNGFPQAGKSRNFTRQVLPLARPRRKNGQRSVVKMLFKLCARTLFGQNLYKYPLPTRQAHKFCEIILIHGDNARPEFRLPFQAAIYFSSVSQLLS